MADEFEYQLKAQEQYTQSAGAASAVEGETYVDPSDGTVYVWDSARRGWFPKVDDDFLAAYHASYGLSTGEPSSTAQPSTTAQSSRGGTVTGNTSSPLERDASGFLVPQLPPSKMKVSAPQLSSPDTQPADKVGTKRPAHEDMSKDQEDSKKKKIPNEKQTPQWFEMDEEKNHNVYVSGLPLDFTTEEFEELMKKCGIISENEDGNPKLKLYKDSDGNVKGDGLCCYLKKESIVLAIQLLDGSQIKGRTLSVEKAKFVQRGDYNPALKKRKKNQKKKKMNKQEKLLDWRERRTDGPSRKKNERIIVFRNVFDPKEFDDDPTLITDIKSDLNEECSTFGTVKKILIFDRHPEGITSVAFAEFEAADMCIARMDQRWYAGRQLSVEAWDGITNFQIEETDQERDQRLQKWEDFLTEGESAQEEDGKGRTESAAVEMDEEEGEEEEEGEGDDEDGDKDSVDQSEGTR